MFSDISAVRSANRAELMGTSTWASTDETIKMNTPNTATGQASRQGEKPVACTTTSSLSAINRFVV